ncbi:trimeric autotransporter adhesin [Volucribacter psittacicida]|uniref:Trimeric autotransporter adhesin n=1 Tax=Volucribacter psittacicida TaxID=203482 RepID=A0A4R1FVE8_9PAST|nr:YadA-like family protein [Volucribacter psittacicida]TCJ97832.1 trimeric autotransporter adhesin [Volucribacter psittacicida]
MNKVFKVIWNKTTNSPVVTSELAKGNVKASSQSSVQQTVNTQLTIGNHQFILSSITVAIMMFASVNSYAAVQIGSTSTSAISSENAAASYANGNSIAIGSGSVANARSNTYTPTAPATGTQTVLSAVAIGEKANATGAQALALGANTLANGENSIALGANSASSTNSIAIGRGANADNQNGSGGTISNARSIAIGDLSYAASNQSLAIGSSTKANGRQATAIGNDTTADGYASVAIGGDDMEGVSATAKALYASYIGSALIDTTNSTTRYVATHAKGGASVAVGVAAQALGEISTAVGAKAKADGDMAMALGVGSNATGQAAFAAGVKAQALANKSMAFGVNALANQEGAIAYGTDTKATGLNAVVLGASSTASGQNAMALGTNAISANQTSIAIGANALAQLSSTATKQEGETGLIAIGENSQAIGDLAIAIGKRAQAAGAWSLATGHTAQATGESSTAYGYAAKATANNASAFGALANANGIYSVAFGRSATANANGTTAIGYNTKATSADSTVIGRESVVTGARAVAIGYKSNANAEDALSMGSNAIANAISTVALSTSAIASGANAIAIGNKAQATGTNAISIGVGNVVSGNNSGAIGDPTTITGDNSYSLGNNNTVNASNATVVGNTNTLNTVAGNSHVIGNNNTVNAGSSYVLANNANVGADSTGSADSTGNIAIGTNVVTNLSNATAIGTNAKAENSQAVAIGTGANANAINSMALGSASLAQGNSAVAIGNGAQAISSNSFAGGNAAYANGNSATALGSLANANGKSSTALGTSARASKEQATALGSTANANGTSATAIGAGANASADNATALGVNAIASQSSNLALGSSANASGSVSIAVGSAATASGNAATVVGQNASGAGASTVAIGSAANASKNNAVAIGYDAKASDSSAVALGYGANASKAQATALGTMAVASGSYSTALGNNAISSAKDALALGSNTSVSVENSVALGANSLATSAVIGTSSASINGISYATFAGVKPVGTVSVGSAGNERTITNVAAGRVSATSTDAINGSQLYLVANTAGNIANSVKNILGGNAVVGNDGTITMTNIGGTGLNTIDGAVAAAKTEVIAGRNTVVNSGTGENGQTVYTVSANTASVAVNPESLKVGSILTTDDKGVENIEYNLDLSDSTKDRLAKADSAMQSIVAKVNGSEVKSLDQNNNQLNFVNGTGTTAQVKVNENGVSVQYDVNTATLSTNESGVVSSDKEGNTFATAKNVADNINNVANALTTKGLTFAGDSGSNVQRDLGEILTLRGGVTEDSTLTDNNIGVIADGEDTLTIKLAKTLTGLTSVSANTFVAGNTTITTNGVTIGNGEKQVSLTSTGLNNGGNQIINVASGLGDNTTLAEAVGDTLTNAANIGDLQNAINESTTRYYSVNDNGTQKGNYNNDGATGENALAAGVNAQAAGNNAVAVGNNSQANSENVVSVGLNAGENSTNNQGSVMIGNNAGKNSSTSGEQNYSQNVYIGENAGLSAQGYWNTFVGDSNTGANTVGNMNVALGGKALYDIKGSENTGLGVYAGQHSTGDYNSSVGAQAGRYVNGDYNIAFGYDAGSVISGNGNVSIGKGANSNTGQDPLSVNNTVAIGNEAKATNDNDVALGADSQTKTAEGTTEATIGSLTYGNFAGSVPIATVSVGSEGNERTITNVAAGRISATSTDAINGSQLYLVANTASNIATSVENILGGNAELGTDGTITMTNIGGTGLNTIDSAVAAAKTEVIAGRNTVVNSGTGENGQTVYTVSANTASVTVNPESLKVGSTLTTDEKGVENIEYNLDLSDSTKDRLAKADSAMQSIVAKVNGSEVKSLDQNNNQLNFVNGTGTTAQVKADENGVSVQYDVNTATLSTDESGVVSSDKEGNTFATAKNVADSINNVANALTSKGLTFAGDSGSNVQRDLGETLKVAGGVTENDKLTDGNIGVVADGEDTLTIKLAKTLTGLTSVYANSFVAGNTTITTNGVTIGNGEKQVSLTSTGLNNGGNQITNVASGLGDNTTLAKATGDTLNNAANIGDLQNAVSNVTEAAKGGGFILSDDNNAEVKQDLGKAIQLTGESGVTVTADVDNNKLTIGLDNEVTVGNDTEAGTITVKGNANTSGVVLNGAEGSITLNNGDTQSTLSIREGESNLADDATNRIQYTQADGSVSEVATLDDGLKFKGNQGDTIRKALNDTLTIKGGLANDDDASSENLRVDSEDDALVIKLANTLTNLTAANFVDSDGNTTEITGSSITTSNAEGDVLALRTAEGTVFFGGNNDIVSLTNNGLDNGGNQITNVASGLGDTPLANAKGDTLTNAANIGDLQNAVANVTEAAKGGGFILSDDSNTEVKQDLGQAIQLTGKSGVTVTADADNNKLTIGLDNEVTVGNDTEAGTIRVKDGNGTDGVVLNGEQGSISLSHGETKSTLMVEKGTNTLNNEETSRIIYTQNDNTPVEVATLNDGLKFAGNQGETINKALNDTLTIKGGLSNDADASSENLRVDSEDGALVIKLANTLTNLTAANFVDSDGNTTEITGSSITTSNAEGDVLALRTAEGTVFFGGNNDIVSLTNNGLDNGGNQITNVASGLGDTPLANAKGDTLTNAANIGDLQNAVANVTEAAKGGGFILSDDSKTEVKQDLGQAIQLTGESGVTVTADVDNNKLTIGLDNEVTVGNDTEAGTITVKGNANTSGVVLNGAEGSITLNNGDTQSTLSIREGESNLAGDATNRIQYTQADGSVSEVATLDDGLKFKGNQGDTIRKALNDTLTIKGGLANDADASSENLRVDSEDGALVIKLANTLTNLTAANFVDSDGNTTEITGSSITTSNAEGDVLALRTAEGTVFFGGNNDTVSLTNNGLDNGGNQITNVASGLGDNTTLAKATGDTLTNAANIGDLQNAVANVTEAAKGGGFILSDDSKTEVKQDLGQAIQLTGESGVTVTADVDNNKLTIGLDNEVTVGNDTEAGTITVKGNANTSGVVLNGAEGSITLNNGDTQSTLSIREGESNLADDATNRIQYTQADGSVSEVATLDDGLKFKGNQGETIDKALNETLTIKGGLANDADASSENLRVDSEDGELVLKLATNLTGLTSASFNDESGNNTTITGNNIVMTDSENNIAYRSATETSFTNANGSTVSLSAEGLNNGGAKITNVAAGTEDTDAVNLSQLKAAQAAATTKVIEGDNIQVNALQNDDGSYIYQVSTTPDLNVNTVTTGETVMNSEGVKVGENVSLTQQGLKVDKIEIQSDGINMADNKITGVKNGDISATSTDAVNGRQLNKVYNFSDDMITLLGGNATMNEQGNIAMSNIGGTGYDNINDAVAAAKTEVKAGSSNVNVTADKGENGQAVYTVDLARDIDVDSVTAGNTLINNNGVTIGNVSLSENGLNNGGKKLTNVATGTEDTDAVNVAQLNKAAAAATTKVTQGDNIEVTASTNPDGSTTYQVATAKDVNFTSVTVGNVAINESGINAGNNKITNVAAGEVSENSTDAVNGSQLHATNQQVNNNTNAINHLANDLHRTDRKLRAGVAGAVATAGLPQAYLPGKSMVALAGGTYSGESAIAIGASRISDNGKVIIKLTGSSNTRGDLSGSVGVGYQW